MPVAIYLIINQYQKKKKKVRQEKCADYSLVKWPNALFRLGGGGGNQRQWVSQFPKVYIIHVVERKRDLSQCESSPLIPLLSLPTEG